MKISGSNVFTQGSKIPVALGIENLSPAVDLKAASAELKAKFYALDEHGGVFPNAKTLELSYSSDSDKFIAGEEYNTFACAVDTAQLDCGRLAGELSWKMTDEDSGLPAEPHIPFITDFIIQAPCQSPASPQ